MRTTARDRCIDVVLADDHPVVRQGVRSTLSAHEHIRIVGEAGTGQEALELAAELHPDVVLMDVSMPVMSGIEATRELRDASPDVKVIALTMHEGKEYVAQIMRSGARGYVLKDAPPSELVQAIDAVSEGGTYVSARVSEIIFEDYQGDSGTERRRERHLSPREREVVALIANGFSNKEIGARLDISVRTVETHRVRIMSKLDIRTTAGLTKYAVRNGLVELS